MAGSHKLADLKVNPFWAGSIETPADSSILQAMKSLILSCSLSEESKSRKMAEELERFWRDQNNVDLEVLDLRDLALPPCDGGSAYDHPATRKLEAAHSAADAVVFAVPIYNYDVNAAAKNVTELAGRHLTDKVAGFLCSAGGHWSYMAVMTVANSLMLDFRCVIVPRFVYATDDDFSDQGTEALVISSDEVAERVDELAAEVVRLAGATAK